MSVSDNCRLDAAELRWQCDASALTFATTENLTPPAGIIGQENAWEALSFGVQCDAPNQNVYIRGERGTGRMTLVRRLLRQLEPVTDEKRDVCYVHNFKRPDRPTLIILSAGHGPVFKRRMDEVCDFISNDLMQALDSEPWISERSAIQQHVQEKMRETSAPLEADLKQAGMALVPIQQGPVTQTLIFPLVEGQPVPPLQFEQLAGQGKVTEQRKRQVEEAMPQFQNRLQEIGNIINAAYREGAEKVRELNERACRSILASLIDHIARRFDSPAIRDYLDHVIRDVVDQRLGRPAAEVPDPATVYGVNVVITHAPDNNNRPVVFENTPRLINLLGSVEPHFAANGAVSSDYRGIHGGSLLRAHGGYLVMDVGELLAEPGAWRALMRTLRSGVLEIVPPEVGFMRPHVVVQPEPIPVSVRIILIGDVRTYYQLDALDSDFREYFKVLVDLDNEIERSAESVSRYAHVVANLAREESLPPFEPSAVIALAEHGARIAARAGKLTARFGRIADIAREAAYIANQQALSTVNEVHVRESVARTRKRASMPSRRFREALNSGTIVVATDGEVVGQINGLAVISSGPLTYGFPARITATISPGRAGLINIEGQASMSGSIHTKGFHILGGLLRHLLLPKHPLAFSASIAFEQSYGGIDGDSASGAEMVCLLSALTAIPIRQSLAMTGAIDQHGRIEAIGGVNEKIEGFFDVCQHRGLTGDQGVVIPRANAADLMLRQEVVERCAAGEFQIYAVDTIQQALTLFTRKPAGQLSEETGQYEAGSLLQIAVDKAEEYWRNTLVSPDSLVTEPEPAAITDAGEPPALPGAADRTPS